MPRRFARSVLVVQRHVRNRRFPLRVCAAALLAALVVALTGQLVAAGSNGTARILVIYASHRGFSPFEQFHEQFLAALRSEQHSHVEVQTEFLDVMVTRGEEYERVLTEYVRQKYSGTQFDAIVGVTAPAARVAASLRAGLFPSATLVIASVDQKVAEGLDFGGNMASVTGTVDVEGTVALAIRLRPETRHVAVVLGSSEMELAWLPRVLAEIRAAARDVEPIELVGLSKAELLDRIGSLPPDTVVLWGAFWRGAEGESFAPAEVLAEVRAVTSSPMFGLFEHDLGGGIVGGRIVDLSRQGREAGAVVTRVVDGARPVDVSRHIGPNPVQVDWRELRRWGIDPRSLPADAVVHYHDRTVWSDYKWYILGGVAVILVQMLLIVGLALQRSKRVRAQEALAERLRFEELVAALATRFSNLRTAEIDSALDTGLEAIRALFKADRVSLIYLNDSLGPPTVEHSAVAPGVEPLGEAIGSDGLEQLTAHVRHVGTLQFSRAEEIPAFQVSLKTSLEQAGVRAAIVAPLRTAGVMLGAVGVAMTREPRVWHHELAMRLEVLADILANALMRKRAAAELRKREVLSAAVLEAIGLQICVLDRDGRTIAVNDAWKAACREPDTHPFYLFDNELWSADPEQPAPCVRPDVAHVRTGIRSVLDGSSPSYSIEYCVTRPDADTWLLLTAEPLGLPEGGAVVSHQNITSRKRAELDSEQRQQELAHVSRVSTLGELAASIAHELNQPLTGMLSNAQAALRFLAIDPSNVGEVREILRDIIDDDRRAGEVIRRLRSMLQTGTITPAKIDLSDVTSETLKLVAGDALLRHVSIRLDLTSDLPRVRGDQIQLQQVILNLVVNAMDAMRETEPHDRVVTIRTSLEDRETVTISVSDRGHGIAHGELGRIFEPFFTTKSDGLGMGLSIARTIVEAHGGALSARNEETGGATLTCRLPIATAEGFPEEPLHKVVASAS
jgi:signal transduction histidine kinase